MAIKTKSVQRGTKSFSGAKNPGQINIAVFGDVHLGHDKTKTNEIISKLYKLFPENEATRALDFIFIEGDLFDHLLYLNNEHMATIVLWVEWLLNKCKKHQIALRLLEGTPSHDMRQPEMVASLAEKYGDALDFKYVHKLDVEFHTKTGLSILYLPDEWNTPERCIVEAKELIHSHGLERVDLVCMHGAFDYQLPEGMGISTHNRQEWESIVNYYIMVGHVHFPSQNGKVLAAGSFDRLRHGEEGPKGHIRICLKEEKSKVEFVENREAKWYKTICCRGLEFEELLVKIEECLKDAPKGSYFRVAGKRSEGIATVRTFMADKYPDYNWSDPLVDEEVAERETVKVLETTFVPICLTKDNLPKLLMERLSPIADEATLGRCDKLLTEVL